MLPQHSPLLDASLSYVLGERWLGVPALSFTDSVTLLPPTSSTLTSASLRIRKNNSLTTVLTIAASVVSSANWTITIADRLMPEITAAGKYDYTFKTVDSNSRTQSWFNGTFVVAAD